MVVCKEKKTENIERCVNARNISLNFINKENNFCYFSQQFSAMLFFIGTMLFYTHPLKVHISQNNQEKHGFTANMCQNLPVILPLTKCKSK